MSGQRKQTYEDRFWSKVDKSGDCWVWTANCPTPPGYGLFRDKRNGKWANVAAHRVSYVLAYGKIPEGYEIDHICRNRACVRPEHLRAVTHKQNIENADPAGNSNNTSGVRGVYWSTRRRRWIARLIHNGKSFQVGSFVDVEEARKAITAARIELYTHNELDRKAA